MDKVTHNKRSLIMKRLKKSLFTVGVLVAGFFFSPTFSQDAGTSADTYPKMRKAEKSEMRPSVAINGGLAATESRAGAVGYGIEAGFQPYIPIGTAIELGSYTTASDGATPGLTRTKVMFKGNYN